MGEKIICRIKQLRNKDKFQFLDQVGPYRIGQSKLNN